MDPHAVETIEMELAHLIRRLIAETTYRKSGDSLDRAAYLLLDHIAGSGWASVKTLAEEFRLDSSTISRQTAALEKKGHLARRPVENDRRAYTLELTELGRLELERNKQMRTERVGELLEGWTAQEVEQFSRLLQKFGESVSEG
ncbi:MarR family winged helix-turn-helix transcriptional regulator [Paenibacillus pasadenensis]|uniref:Transcriptional regulator, MarR family n=1 Tax=Paenibacillus pasadenensis TaxID=217090 RepID=A0A2N5N8P9_9BACL|nr:MarR family transcriptional regulator [Paenibacillus pasadenensis]PLT46714.1 Transcriptional regulator, MarR family [Paenibacillus pasadenensis]